MKTLAIIGSTGSIGKATLNVLKKNKSKFKLIYFTGFNNYKLLNKQDFYFNPKNIYLFNNKSNLKLINKKKNLSFEKFLKNYLKKKIDYVVSAVSGYDSLIINLKLLNISKNILLANKETIVCGGKFFLNKASKLKCNIIPIDSEHHCIDFFLKNFKKVNCIKSVTLTASGGPFLNKKIKYNEKISNVLNHPNWKMGRKISVDSSTFANKVLELFEAQNLFDLKPQMLKILVDSTSKIHSIITLNNNLSFLIAHQSKMEIPISNSLNLTNSFEISCNILSTNLKIVDMKKFPLVKLGFEILKSNHFDKILFTVLNERLVNEYLNNKIFYGDIVKKLVNFFNNNNKIVFNKKKCIRSLSDIKKTIKIAENIKL